MASKRGFTGATLHRLRAAAAPNRLGVTTTIAHCLVMLAAVVRAPSFSPGGNQGIW